MSVTVKGKTYDAMKEACARLGISRSSLLRYLTEGFFTLPPTTKQGKGKPVRYFDEAWYNVNEPKLNAPVTSPVVSHGGPGAVESPKSEAKNTDVGTIAPTAGEDAKPTQDNSTGENVEPTKDDSSEE